MKEPLSTDLDQAGLSSNSVLFTYRQVKIVFVVILYYFVLAEEDNTEVF